MNEKRTAILDATRELLAEGGVHGLTVEGVAARAGVAKTTIYRRWRSKDELAFAVLIDMVEQFVATPDLDDTRDELVAFVAAAVRILGTTLMGRVMQGLVSDLAADPELARRVPRGGRRHAGRRGAPARRARDRARGPAARHRPRARPRAAVRAGLLPPHAQRRAARRRPRRAHRRRGAARLRDRPRGLGVMRVTALDHLVLTVADLDATVAFYERLGMACRRFGDGRLRAPLRAPEDQPAPRGRRVRAARPAAERGSADLCFLVDEPIAGGRAQSWPGPGSRSRSGRSERTGAQGPLESVYVRDPDGNLIELVYPL